MGLGATRSDRGSLNHWHHCKSVIVISTNKLGLEFYCHYYPRNKLVRDWDSRVGYTSEEPLKNIFVWVRTRCASTQVLNTAVRRWAPSWLLRRSSNRITSTQNGHDIKWRPTARLRTNKRRNRKKSAGKHGVAGCPAGYWRAVMGTAVGHYVTPRRSRSEKLVRRAGREAGATRRQRSYESRSQRSLRDAMFRYAWSGRAV